MIATPSSADLHELVGLVQATDMRLQQLAHDGIIGPHHACAGEEPTLVGAAAALDENDWVFWGSQVCVPALTRGMDVGLLFSEAFTPGATQSELAERKIVTKTHGAAARLPHATGLAWAARQDGVAVLCELGDGAISDADFHVGVNFAAVMNAPVVFVVRNGVDAPAVTPRAIGYGIRSTRVDGMEATEVKDVVSNALDEARTGTGPVLIEAVTQRGQQTYKGANIAFGEQIESAITAAERARHATRAARG